MLRWGSFLISAMALLFAFLKGPVAWSIRAAIQEQLRTELTSYNTRPSPPVLRDRLIDPGEDLLKRLNHDQAVLQEVTAAAQTNTFHLLDLTRRLAVVETNLATLKQDFYARQIP